MTPWPGEPAGPEAPACSGGYPRKAPGGIRRALGLLPEGKAFVATYEGAGSFGERREHFRPGSSKRAPDAKWPDRTVTHDVAQGKALGTIRGISWECRGLQGLSGAGGPPQSPRRQPRGSRAHPGGLPG